MYSTVMEAATYDRLDSSICQHKRIQRQKASQNKEYLFNERNQAVCVRQPEKAFTELGKNRKNKTGTQ